MNWWQRVRHRGRMEQELDAELRFHFDRLVDENVRAARSGASAPVRLAECISRTSDLPAEAGSQERS